MKKILYYLILTGFTINGAYGMTTNIEFSFMWWLNFINVFGCGGYLVMCVLNYLKD